MVGAHKWEWHLKIFLALWAYKTSIKNTTRFTLFQLVYGLEAILPIECKIPSFKLAVDLQPNTSTEEEHFLYLAQLYETHHDATLANETHKKHIKVQYEKSIRPRAFAKGDLVLVYDQDHEKLG